MAKSKSFDEMDPSELEKARAEAQAQLEAISKAESASKGRKVKEMRASFEAMAAKEGMTLEEIMGGGGKAKRNTAGRAKGPARYRHPENDALTWTGRGRQPKWIKDHEASGGSREDFAV